MAFFMFIYTSNDFLDEANAAGLDTTLWAPLKEI